MGRWFLAMALLSAIAEAQPKRILYLTTSAGFRHGSLPVSAQVLRDLAARSGDLDVTATEDLNELRADRLRTYDAALFFTSGELPISAAQKSALLEFVREGRGFGGVHSATDTLYEWPEYGELIGARFHGHPWTQQVRIDVEDPSHPAAAHLAPSFAITDEIYQFQSFSRNRVRVLMTLDTRSVDLRAPDTNAGTEDFPLAWTRSFGSGRVFYTALGHFDETWRDERFQRMILQAMRWLAGLVEGEGSARPAMQPEFGTGGVANAASFSPAGVIAPGSIVTVFGRNLTSGSTMAGSARKLAGATVNVNGSDATLLYASPGQINAFVPHAAAPREGMFSVRVTGAGDLSAAAAVRAAQATPGVFAMSVHGGAITLWTTGLGPVEPNGPYQTTTLAPAVVIGGRPARILFSGLSPGFAGLYQVNAEIPEGTASPAQVEFSFAGVPIVRLPLNGI